MLECSRVDDAILPQRAPKTTRAAAEPGRSARIHTGYVVVVVLLALVVRTAAVRVPVQVLDGRTLADDAYLALEISKNVGTGRGPRYGDAYTNGFQPLYVFLAAPIFAGRSAAELRDLRILDRSVHIALCILAAFDLVALVVLGEILRRRHGAGLATIAGMTLWAVHPTVVLTVLNGLETSIATAFVLAIWLAADTWARVGAPRWAHLVVGALLGFGTLARIDVLFLAVPIGCLVMVQGGTARTCRSVVTALVSMAVGFVVVYSPWLAYSWATTGTLVPVSGRAVRFMSLANVGQKPDAAFYGHMMRWALRAVWQNSPLLWGLSSVVAVLAVTDRLWRGRRSIGARLLADLRGTFVLVGFCLLLFAAYTGYIFARWFFARYLFVCLLIPLSVLAAAAARIEARLPVRWRGARGHAAVVLGVLSIALCEPRAFELYRETGGYGYRNLGLWARQAFADGTVIGSSQTGALGYYASNLKVVNLDGVVNQAAFESLREHRNVDYIRSAGIQYVIGWDVNIDFIRAHSQAFRDDDLPLLGIVPGVVTVSQPWYLYWVRR